MAYNNLGASIGNGSITMPSGVDASAKDLYLAALELDQNNPNALVNLGCALGRQEKATLPDGEEVSEAMLYLKAMERNLCASSTCAAFINLASTLEPEERVVLPDGRAADERSLYMMAIERDDRASMAYS